jgi:hypothetical protein
MRCLPAVRGEDAVRARLRLRGCGKRRVLWQRVQESESRTGAYGWNIRELVPKSRVPRNRRKPWPSQRLRHRVQDKRPRETLFSRGE